VALPACRIFYLGRERVKKEIEPGERYEITLPAR
jgi:hypothetical protein